MRIDGATTVVVGLTILCTMLFVVVGVQIGTLNEVDDMRLRYLEDRDILLSVIQAQEQSIQGATVAIDGISRVIREVAHVDYMLDMGQQLESVKERLVTDFQLDESIDMGIGGCEDGTNLAKNP